MARDTQALSTYDCSSAGSNITCACAASSAPTPAGYLYKSGPRCEPTYWYRSPSAKTPCRTHLLFGASLLNLKIRDIPVRYKDRTYCKTNISPFKHGWLLLKMTAFGLVHLKWR